MTDTTITKIDSTHSPKGAAGQKYLACGKSMSMRLWEKESSKKDQTDTKREYETIGFVIKGKAELHLEGQMVLLNAGDCWVVPKGASHHYKILEEFSAVESTSPPAELHDRSREEHALSPKEFFEIGAHDAEAVKSAEPVKGASASVKAKAQTETKAEEQAKPQSPDAIPKDVSDGKPQAEEAAKQTVKEESAGSPKAEAENKNNGQGHAEDAAKNKAKVNEKNGDAKEKAAESKDENKDESKDNPKVEGAEKDKDDDASKNANAENTEHEATENKDTENKDTDDMSNSKSEKPKEKEDDDDKGQTCDPNTHECKPGNQDGKEGKKENEEPPVNDNQPDNKAEQAQKIVADIPRTESAPTSNSPPKEPKPAEHQDVGDKS